MKQYRPEWQQIAIEMYPGENPRTSECEQPSDLYQTLARELINIELALHLSCEVNFIDYRTDKPVTENLYFHDDPERIRSTAYRLGFNEQVQDIKQKNNSNLNNLKDIIAYSRKDLDAARQRVNKKMW